MPVLSRTFTLRNFTEEEVAGLYGQHTEQTGQVFSPQVVERAFHYSQGQPWLVNAIAREVVEDILDFDFSLSIKVEHIEQAVQNIILHRDTHIDSLLERLKEKRVQRIVEPVLLGEIKGYDLLDDDYQYVLDLGLLRDGEDGLEPSNPLYGEAIIRTLSFGWQMEMRKRKYPPPAVSYLAGNRLDMNRLLGDFQQFWRENSEMWVDRYQYKEAAPHLILQAFLQRVINAGGRISREMAEGSRRLDLCVHYQGISYSIELKLRYSDKVYEEGKAQLAGYMDRLGCAEGWLVVFDRRKKPSWDEKIFQKTEQLDGKTIYVVGV